MSFMATDMAREVERHLGGFRFALKWGHTPTLAHNDGRELFFHGRKADRVEISGGYPDSDFRPERFVISVGRARAGLDVAKEITRRLLPRYEAELARVVNHIADKENNALAREVRASHLAGILHTDDIRGRCRDETWVHWTGKDATSGHLRLSVSGATVNAEIRGLPFTTAEALCRVLAEVMG